MPEAQTCQTCKFGFSLVAMQVLHLVWSFSAHSWSWGWVAQENRKWFSCQHRVCAQQAWETCMEDPLPTNTQWNSSSQSFHYDYQRRRSTTWCTARSTAFFPASQTEELWVPAWRARGGVLQLGVISHRVPCQPPHVCSTHCAEWVQQAGGWQEAQRCAPLSLTLTPSHSWGLHHITLSVSLTLITVGEMAIWMEYKLLWHSVTGSLSVGWDSGADSLCAKC